MGRTHLDVLHEIGQAHSRMQAGENMKMILYAIDAINVSVTIADDAANVAEEFLSAFRREDTAAVLGRKYNVIGDRSVSGHASDLEFNPMIVNPSGVDPFCMLPSVGSHLRLLTVRPFQGLRARTRARAQSRG